MKKKNTKVIIESLNDSNIRMSVEPNGQLFFEIGNDITTDVSEAVAIMMRKNIDESIWNKTISINYDDIEPRRTLYWLSGGDSEWMTFRNYSTPWCDCDLDFQEEFGFMVISILKKSKTLGDIRDGFIKYLNLPVLYEFALNKGFIR